MNDRSERDKAVEQTEENGQRQSGSHDDAFKQDGKKALMFDSNGFIKEVGERTWRKHDSCEDQ